MPVQRKKNQGSQSYLWIFLPWWAALFLHQTILSSSVFMNAHSHATVAATTFRHTNQPPTNLLTWFSFLLKSHHYIFSLYSHYIWISNVTISKYKKKKHLQNQSQRPACEKLFELDAQYCNSLVSQEHIAVVMASNPLLLVTNYCKSYYCCIFTVQVHNFFYGFETFCKEKKLNWQKSGKTCNNDDVTDWSTSMHRAKGASVVHEFILRNVQQSLIQVNRMDTTLEISRFCIL